METLTEKVISYLTEQQQSTGHSQLTLERLKAPISEIIREHENPKAIPGNMSYEILSWEDLKKLIPGVKVYEGGSTRAGMEGILNMIERKSPPNRIFHQIVYSPNGELIYIFRVIN